MKKKKTSKPKNPLQIKPNNEETNSSEHSKIKSNNFNRFVSSPSKEENKKSVDDSNLKPKYLSNSEQKREKQINEDNKLFKHVENSNFKHQNKETSKNDELTKSSEHSNKKSNRFVYYPSKEENKWSVEKSFLKHEDLSTSNQKPKTKGSDEKSYFKPEDLLTRDQKREKRRAEEKSKIEMNRITVENLKYLPHRIKRHCILNLAKINQVMGKDPPIPIFMENGIQADSLPTMYFQIYDINGNDTKLGFEEKSIFIHTEEQEVERINYNEIDQIAFVPYNGYNKSFVILVLDTYFGIKILPFVQRKYTSVIEKIINERKELIDSDNDEDY